MYFSSSNIYISNCNESEIEVRGNQGSSNEDNPEQPLVCPSCKEGQSRLKPQTYSTNGDKQDLGIEMSASRSIKSEIDGFQAWLTLACIFITNATTLGSLKVYALIFEEIVSQNYYNREEASWPISTASTVQNLAGLLTPLMATKTSWCSIELIQTFLFVTANIGAYFSRGLSLDIFCLGLVQGIAFSIRYNMNVVINNEYFLRYRATAMGVSLAGSTCGVFLLKPIISYVLDSSGHNFRNAYLALAVVMACNLLPNLFIRKPEFVRSTRPLEVEVSSGPSANQENSIYRLLMELIKNPSLHCLWMMQTVYFYISRSYTIFITDYGFDSGLTKNDSRGLVDFWVFGELGGRLLLGGIVDSRLINLKWNIIIVNILLAISGFSLVGERSHFHRDTLMQDQKLYSEFYWLFGMSVAAVAALSSLVNMMIVPFGQEYLGKKNVPWAFATGSIITSFFLLLRPILIGLSRDHYKTYDYLIILMSLAPVVYALLFICIEPYLKRSHCGNMRSSNND